MFYRGKYLFDAELCAQVTHANWVPLLDTKLFGIPKRQTMFFHIVSHDLRNRLGQSPKCGKAMGYGLTVIPLGAHDANRYVVGIACITVRTSCSPPSWLASSTLLERFLKRELARRCDSHKYLHGVQP